MPVVWSELLLALFDVFEKKPTQRDSTMKEEEAYVCESLMNGSSVYSVSGTYDAKAGFNLESIRAIRDVMLERLELAPDSEVKDGAIFAISALGSPHVLFVPDLPHHDSSDAPESSDDEDDLTKDFRYAGCVGDPWQATNGLLQGDPPSVVIFLIVFFALCSCAFSLVPDLSTFADDLHRIGRCSY